MAKNSSGPRLPASETASPTQRRSSAPVNTKTCQTRTASTASPRSESNSGKRGLPGGGATAGEVT